MSTSRGPGRTAAVLLAVAAGTVALGPLYALAWSAFAPDIPLVKVDGGVVPAEPAPEQMVAGDGWFALLGVGLGVVVAVAVWFLARRWRGPLVLLAMAVGAVTGGALAGRLGQRIGLSEYNRTLAAAALGADVTHPPALRVEEGVVPQGVLLVFALAAVITYAILAGWSRHGTLRPGDPAPDYDAAWPPPEEVGPGAVGSGAVGPGSLSQGAVSSGSWERPDPPAVPAPPGPDEGAPPRG